MKGSSLPQQHWPSPFPLIPAVLELGNTLEMNWSKFIISETRRCDLVSSHTLLSWEQNPCILAPSPGLLTHYLLHLQDD